MSYTVTNISNGDVSLDQFHLPVHTAKTVEYISKDMFTAKANGYITISPDITSGLNTELTDGTGATVTDASYVGPVVAAADANDPLAVLTHKVNQLQSQVEQLLGHVLGA